MGWRGSLVGWWGGLGAQCSGQEQRRSWAWSWAAMGGGGGSQWPWESIPPPNPQPWSCTPASDRTPHVPRLPQKGRDLLCWLAGHLEERKHLRGKTWPSPTIPPSWEHPASPPTPTPLRPPPASSAAGWEGTRDASWGGSIAVPTDCGRALPSPIAPPSLLTR